MGPPVIKVQSDTKLPESTSVVIIGGGIIGTSAALFLSQRGIPTVLCEKGHIAGEQSSRNWGWCRKMARDPREIPLAIEALRLWGDMNRITGVETGFRQSGIMYMCDTQQELARYESWMDHARDYQLDTRMLSGAEVSALMPGASKTWAGAIYTASDGKGEPQMGAPVIAAAAQRNGATILQRCAVRGIDSTGGRVTGVITEKGRIACQSVVLAGGAWSRLMCGSMGIELPQLKVLLSVLRTEKLEGRAEDIAPAVERALASGKAALVHIAVDPIANSSFAGMPGLGEFRMWYGEPGDNLGFAGTPPAVAAKAEDKAPIDKGSGY